ncbi:UBP7 (YIL156W) and UBP11 (YKR098C) [Zygosaccharomyces parabailii]|nr:UBP7 (YIL156W) and UBP11 (YKR098C) [Zygosaccharomyces parabailii]CDH17443.1 related to Ubiquitin carboxyl-terminal hydrolase 7 [Zygosaccharomyces bailii ISA1307]
MSSASGSSFTPEYSNELLRRVKNIYEDDIRTHYAILKLEDLSDLLEHTRFLFESFSDDLNRNKTNDALTAYIVGCYFLYLIIPQSIQFKARNKSFTVHNELKKQYEDQHHMANVLIMVKNEVDSILDRDFRKMQDVERSRAARQRAYSFPDRGLESGMSYLTLGGGKASEASMSHDAVHSDGELHSEGPQESPLWKAPNLEPNDQLRLALDSAVLSSSSVDTFGREDSPEASQSPLRYSKHKDGRTSHPTSGDKKPEEQHLWDANIDGLVSHRKRSYHTVYMNNGENDMHQRRTADYIQGMKRLQKQSIITSPELFSVLSNPRDREQLLLIDLRMQQTHKSSRIVAPNTVLVDPKNLWDSKTNTPITDVVLLEKRLNSPLFNRRGSFNYIVYYTDMATYMHLDYDYLFAFYYLLVASGDVTLKSLPSYLLGGYEKWKAVMKKYTDQFGINVDQYLERPQTENKSASATKPKALEQIPWKPPAVPERIRIRPPPPAALASVRAKQTDSKQPPPVPPKIHLSSDCGTPERHHSTSSSSSSDSEDSGTAPAPAPRRLENRHRRRSSVPTIEQSNNKYVALSITGLRNMGSTCYINGMVQCLFATKMLRDLFEPSNYEKFISRKIKDGGKLSQSFSSLFHKMYMNGGCSVVPNSFLKVCNQLRPDFNIPDDQQDTQEFLMLVIDRLHDELSNQSEVINAYPELLLYDQKALQVKKDEYKRWFESSVIRNGFSPIDAIFQGQLENGLHCQRCGYSSYSYSTFYILSLAIPKPATGLFSNKERWVKLEDCINMFTSDEVMSGDNAWDCPKCGSTAQAEREKKVSHHSHHQPSDSESPEPKKLRKKNEEESKSKSMFLLFPRKARSMSPFHLLSPSSSNNNNTHGDGNGSSSSNSSGGGSGTHGHGDARDDSHLKRKKLYAIRASAFIVLPPVLVIHLSRFYYDLTKKNNTIITYPLYLNIALKNKQVLKYRLYGVVNHDGNLISGHYTCLVNKNQTHDLEKGQDQWFYFDDEVVKHETNHGNLEKGITKVSSSDVYVLFYERIG